MSAVIPEGWSETTLGKFSNIQSGVGFPKKYQGKMEGTYPVYKVGDVSKGVQNNKGILTKAEYYVSETEAIEMKGKVFEIGSTLFAKIGEAVKLNRRGFVKVAGLADNNVMSVKAHLSEMDQWTHYYLKTIDLATVSRSTTVPSVRKGDIEELRVNLPPLAEQKVIADKLDELLAQVESTKASLDAIPAILKSFRQSVLKAAVSGKLTEEWREGMQLPANNNDALRDKIYKAWLEARNAEFDRKGKQPKTQTWLTKFPEPQFLKSASLSWISLSLENIAEVLDPNPSHRMPKYVTDGIPFISSENIQKINKLDFKKGKKITSEELVKQKTRYEITDGTFAFTRIGTIGKSVLLPSPHEYGISHAMAVVTPYKTIIDSSFLILIMNCTTILKQATDGIQSVGVPDLGIGKMKGFKIPVPTLVEQTEIVRRVEELFAFADIVEAQVNAAQARVNNLTQSILAKAFRGELTKEWRTANPDLISGENSAEALLKRIKSERETLTTKSKPSKSRKKVIADEG